MNSKKKNIPLIIILVVVGIIVISGIANSFKDKDDVNTYNPSNTENAIGSSQNETVSDSTNTALKEKSDKVEIPEGGIVIFDKDGITITAQAVKRDSNGLLKGLDLLIENNNEVEKNVCVYPDAAFGGPVLVNGYSMKSSFNETVSAGKKAKTTFTFDDDTVTLLNFDNLYSFSAHFGTYESRDDYMKHEVKTYDPVEFVLKEFSASPTGDLVYNDNGIEIYKCGFKQSFILSYAVFIIKNNGNDSNFEFDSVSINDIMLDRTLTDSVDIFGGSYAVILQTLGEDDKEENIKSIEFTLKKSEINEIFSLDKETIDIITVNY